MADAALKKFLIGEVEDIYLISKHHHITGYANMTTLVLNGCFSRGMHGVEEI